MPGHFARAMNDATIRSLAGEQSYQRGLDYFSRGHVTSVEERGGSIHGVVRGTRDYAVALSTDDGILDYSCDCPIGSDGEFCKHCVAVALDFLNRTTKSAKPLGLRKPKGVTLADAGKILRAEDKDVLVNMLLDWAKDDARLHERLILYAARRAGPDIAVAAVLRAFDQSVRVRGFVSYREATAWANGVDDAIDSIEQLLNDGQPALVIELCESALRSLLGAIEAVDDSGGHFGMLRDRLQDIHYRACREAQPDPTELAKRLFHWELNGNFDVFFGASAQYAEILGANGMEKYRALAGKEWEKVPVRAADHGRSNWRDYFRITHIMKSLAKTSGDIEQLVKVMERDLSGASNYLEIAEVYFEAAHYDNALRWAELGLKAFPDRTDPRLREFAAEEYHRRFRHDDAMKLMWAGFLERPIPEDYKTLEQHAKRAGAWPEWRGRALAEIRLRIAKAKEKARGQARPYWLSAEGTNSPLVEIFLYEGNPDEAWREAQTGSCSDDLWLRLAAAREKSHPEDAAPIYQRLAETRIAAVRNGEYKQSVDLLAKAAATMKRLDRSSEFVRALEALRVKYKIKRNFMKLIEQERKLLYL